MAYGTSTGFFTCFSFAKWPFPTFITMLIDLLYDIQPFFNVFMGLRVGSYGIAAYL